MKIPNGYTEERVLEVFDIVAKRLCKKYKFGFHTSDDIKQYIYQFCCDAINRYDGVSPLENFLVKHAINRLKNEKRNTYERIEKPCSTCPLLDLDCKHSTSQCIGFEDKMECPKYKIWSERNVNKKNIMMPITIDNINDEKETNTRINVDVLDNLDYIELIEFIDKHLPTSLRADYIKMKHNIKIPKQRRLVVESTVLEIMEKYESGIAARAKSART